MHPEMQPRSLRSPGGVLRSWPVWSVVVALAAAACAPSGTGVGVTTAPSPGVTSPAGTTTGVDPRVGLAPGVMNAGEAIWNMALVSKTPPPDLFAGSTNSDLAFRGNYVFQGNFRGFQIWDISDPSSPALVTAISCPGAQGDVSVYGDLLFVSTEYLEGRVDCADAPPSARVSSDRLRGIRIFDISDVANPEYVGNVQTCRGSHTHTLVEDPSDPDHVYIYVSGSAPVRPAEELAGCSTGLPESNPNTALFRIEVIRVPLANPSAAAIVSSPRIFTGLTAPPTRGVPQTVAGPGPNQCHDITVYPEIGLAGGACEGYGLLLDISDPVNPVRLAVAGDRNFEYWHSATFNNDGTRVLFTDEWGGGTGARCRATDPAQWGADAIFEIVDGDLEFLGYYKLPAPQTAQENCVAHNGSLIPIPGRDVMVQAWYQGGISVFDWTDGANPVEIAFFDRGPLNRDRLQLGGSWSAYWYNGLIFSSEIARGLDILELTPSEYLSENEIEAAKTVRLEQFNPQGQVRFVWPPTFALARAYVDQLERAGALPPARIAAVRAELASAEAAPAVGRANALTGLAAQLEADAPGSGDAAKVRLLAETARALASGM
ncbi:MAG TPA: hypothetical protein VNZ57_10440 [Longimicrobiales bacterium]|nr:hypothetical protein [Longimicrobiales bacterium]